MSSLSILAAFPQQHLKRVFRGALSPRQPLGSPPKSACEPVTSLLCLSLSRDPALCPHSRGVASAQQQLSRHLTPSASRGRQPEPRRASPGRAAAEKVKTSDLGRNEAATSALVLGHVLAAKLPPESSSGRRSRKIHFLAAGPRRAGPRPKKSGRLERSSALPCHTA